MVNHTKRYSSILIVDTKNKCLTHKGMIPKDIYKKCRMNIPPQENDGYATVKHFSLAQMKILKRIIITFNILMYV